MSKATLYIWQNTLNSKCVGLFQNIVGDTMTDSFTIVAPTFNEVEAAVRNRCENLQYTVIKLPFEVVVTITDLNIKRG